MIVARRIIPFITPLIVLLSYVAMYLYPEQWYVPSVIGLVLVLVSVSFLLQWHVFHKDFFLAAYPLFLFLVGVTGFAIFLVNTFTQVTAMIGATILVAIYLESIFIYHYQPQQSTNLTYSHLSYLVAVLSVFFLASFGFALGLIGYASPVLLSILAFFLIGLYLLHMLLSYKIWESYRIVTIAAVSALCAQLIWILQYLPTAYYVNGAIVVSVFYLLSSFMQLDFREILDARAIRTYGGIAVIILLLTMLSATWT